MIQRLALRCFRNHCNLQLEIEGAPFVFIQGINGAGKTNILEAISLLIPGRGLKNARNEDILHNTQTISFTWAVDAQLTDFSCVTGAEVYPDKASRRIFRINEQPVSKQRQLTERLRIIWLTPQTEGVFLSSPTNRRKFWDRMAYNIDQEHAKHVSQYEHHTQSRNKLLQSPHVDKVWLARIEQQLAEAATHVIAGRARCVELLSQYLTAEAQFLAPKLGTTGEIIHAYQTERNFTNWFAETLARNRKIDASMGRMKLSASKMDLEASHPIKKVTAAQCSTGEQKSLLISLLLAQARAIFDLHGIVPLLLLDDILENLDKENKQKLISTLQPLKAQTWITGTQDYGVLPYGTAKVEL